MFRPLLDYDTERANIREFLTEYSEDGGKSFPYMEQIARLSRREQVALYVNMDDIVDGFPELNEGVIGNAYRYQRLFGDVVEDLILEVLGGKLPVVYDALDAFIFQRIYMDKKRKEDAGAENVSMKELRTKYPCELLRRFEVFFKYVKAAIPLSVREVHAVHIGKLVKFSGVVIRATAVKPMASVITYTCDICGCESYQPVNSPVFMPARNCISRDCIDNKANGRLQMQIRGSKFVKFQEIRVQELSDQVPVGSIPRSVSVHVTGENTRSCVPGDLVRITGVYVPLLRTGYRQLIGGLTTEVYISAHFIENVNTGGEETLKEDDDLTDEEVEQVSQDNFYDMMAYSIAPEIYGLEDVKKSLLLALIGGTDKSVSGMRVRGCINVLLMGDPGVAKSQLLSYVSRLAARSQYTTGRGSSGVGLTAAIMKDPISGEMTLEGGALVLADRGVCCIDEFDKMIDSDRTAIHEVMEQQTISIAKAGILTTLNARVSIIAAANPLQGRYNPKRSIEHNIDLPAALLSRFDLLWVIQDRPNRDGDKRIAEHITYVHMNGKEPEREGMKPLNMFLVRKYIAICKRKRPVIEETLRDKLVDMYIDLRKDARNNRDSTFTSPRSLLAVIRLSTALARLRLADTVSVGDIDEAIRLLETCRSSVRLEQQVKRRIESPLDQAFDVIREMYQQNKTSDDPSLPLQKVLRKCQSKGITEDVVYQCISLYTSNGVFMQDREGRIIFTVN